MDRCLANLSIKDTERTETALRTELGLQIDEDGKLGKGSAGHIYTARRVHNPKEQVACKLFDAYDGYNWSSFTREAKAYRLIQSNNQRYANIIQYECDFQITIQDPNGISQTKFFKNAHNLDESESPVGCIVYGLVIEKVDMNFEDWLMESKVGGAFDHEQILLELFRQVGSTLQSLHLKHCLCHFDLKMDNFGVVCSANGSFPTIKLLDFGLAGAEEKFKFHEAEAKCAMTFSLEQDAKLEKDEDKIFVDNFVAKCGCAFTLESLTFGRVLVKVIHKVYGKSDKPMDNIQNKTFKKIIIGLANCELTINSAMVIAKSTGLL